MMLPFPTIGSPYSTSRGPIVGSDAKVLESLDTARRVAMSNCAVLVTGESGTGKELLIAALHDASERRSAPLVTLNCGALPESLLESELFGNVNVPASTQAPNEGRVHAAEGGTLLLDEISELSLNVQTKVMRLLQAREYTPVGAARSIKCDVRVVAATNRNLEAQVQKGLFREDLYYRINVVHVHLPPLRERGDDVCEIAKYCLRTAGERTGRSDVVGFTESAYALLRASDWTGNVRALENAVERALLLTRTALIDASDFGPTVHAGAMVPAFTSPLVLPSDGLSLKRAVDEFENELIRQALSRTGGNKNRAAQLLGLNRTTLVEMVKRKKIG